MATDIMATSTTKLTRSILLTRSLFALTLQMKDGVIDKRYVDTMLYNKLKDNVGEDGEPLVGEHVTDWIPELNLKQVLGLEELSDMVPAFGELATDIGSDASKESGVWKDFFNHTTPERILSSPALRRV